METTIINTTQDIINICNRSTLLQRKGDLRYYYVYLHYTTRDIIFYIGQGSHNRAYKYTGRSNKWYDYVGNHVSIIKIVESELSYQESLDLEKQLIKEHQSTIINEGYGHSPNESFTVLCYNKKGTLIKRYLSAEETNKDGFNPPTVRACCGNKGIGRSTHKDLVWCYEKDYQQTKGIIFNMGLTVRKAVEVTFPNGIIKTYPSMNSTKDDGLQPSKVREVLMGTRKSHKNCKFKFIE